MPCDYAPKIFAHRGASESYAEHTRAAYLKAIEDGADGLECDVHLTADGQVVLIHDDDVRRTSSGRGPVAGFTLEALRELDFSSWHSAQIPAEYGTAEDQLLTLDEFMNLAGAAGRPLELAIEFKHGPGKAFAAQLEDRTLAVLRRRGLWEGAQGNLSVSVMSFNPWALQYLAEHAPAIPRCQLVETLHVPTPARLKRRAHAERLLANGEAALAGPSAGFLRRNPEAIAAFRSAGTRRRVWDVATVADVEACREAGVEEITCDDPEAVRALCAARTLWEAYED